MMGTSRARMGIETPERKVALKVLGKEEEEVNKGRLGRRRGESITLEGQDIGEQ